MAMKINKKEISLIGIKIAEFLKNKIFILILAVLSLVVFFDFFIYYKYVYLVEKKEFQVSISAKKLPENKFKKILDDINRRQNNFKNIQDESPKRDIFH